MLYVILVVVFLAHGTPRVLAAPMPDMETCASKMAEIKQQAPDNAKVMCVDLAPDPKDES